jgi:F0F1-type ATP synthase assembly protein I
MSESKEIDKPARNNINEDISVISLAWDLGWMIIIPIIILAIGGAFLDKKFATSPWILLAGIGFSLVITSVMIYGKVTKVLAELGGEDIKPEGKSKKK